MGHSLRFPCTPTDNLSSPFSHNKQTYSRVLGVKDRGDHGFYSGEWALPFQLRVKGVVCEVMVQMLDRVEPEVVGGLTGGYV